MIVTGKLAERIEKADAEINNLGLSDIEMSESQQYDLFSITKLYSMDLAYRHYIQACHRIYSKLTLEKGYELASFISELRKLTIKYLPKEK